MIIKQKRKNNNSPDKLQDKDIFNEKEHYEKLRKKKENFGQKPISRDMSIFIEESHMESMKKATEDMEKVEAERRQVLRQMDTLLLQEEMARSPSSTHQLNAVGENSRENSDSGMS